MTSPRSTYGGGYYSAPPSRTLRSTTRLVAERGTPQIAPIRVPAAYDTGGSNLPALPSALPALPAGPSQQAPSLRLPAGAAARAAAAGAGGVHPAAGAASRLPGRRPADAAAASGAGGHRLRGDASCGSAPRAPQYQDPYNNQQQQYRGY